VLDRVDLRKTTGRDTYDRELDRLQAKLNRLAWKAHDQRTSTILIFEGWDAAGKGSAIRRVTEAVDARLFRVVPIAAPTEEERTHHYLWRFWRHLPRAGMLTIFDRSWYGRVLVERVEGFASTAEWSRAYDEINEFESQLADHGTVLLKFWLHISKDEQLRRFRKRQEIPHKRYKITKDDWRNRRQWATYETAVHDMVTHTSTAEAPWTLVAGNDKRHARLEILKTCCRALKNATPGRQPGD
jgi:polyphosphate kinase 2 (PPK2 family)